MKTVMDLPEAVQFFFLFHLTQNKEATTMQAMEYAIDRAVTAGRITPGQADSMLASVRAGKIELDL